MPSKIDQNLLPPVIRESVDPDILNRAQSIEWSINRDTGEDEHGYLDGSNEDYLGSKSPGHLAAARKARKIEWLDNGAGRDSGFDYTPTSPSLGGNGGKYSSSMRSISSLSHSDAGHNNLPPLDEMALEEFAAINTTKNTGSMKRHPQGQYPFPIYRVNQEQLEGDVVFEVAPHAKPGEKTIHYEKSSRVMNEEELNALGLDPNFFGPNSKTRMDEQEEEFVETSVLKGGRRELEHLYNTMRTDTTGYFDRQRARSASPTGNRNLMDSEQSERKTVIFGSCEEIDREQEFYPYRDAHQGKVSMRLVKLFTSRNGYTHSYY